MCVPCHCSSEIILSYLILSYRPLAKECVFPRTCSSVLAGTTHSRSHPRACQMYLKVLLVAVVAYCGAFTPAAPVARPAVLGRVSPQMAGWQDPYESARTFEKRKELKTKKVARPSRIARTRISQLHLAAHSRGTSPNLHLTAGCLTAHAHVHSLSSSLAVGLRSPNGEVSRVYVQQRGWSFRADHRVLYRLLDFPGNSVIRMFDVAMGHGICRIDLPGQWRGEPRPLQLKGGQTLYAR